MVEGAVCQAGRKVGGIGGRLGGKVEITRSPTYQKAHAKYPDSVNTLERALKREDRFNEWANGTLDSLIRVA